MRRILGLGVALLAFAAPAVARAGNVAMHVQEVPLGGRVLAAAEPAMHFNMVAPHWQGPGQVAYRTHRLHGAWTAWTAADADVAPDGGTGPWHDGDLVWTGASDAIQFRTSGRVTRLKTYELWSRVTTTPPRGLESAGAPAIVTRAQWDANEEIVRAKPLIAKTLKLAVIHHTAGTNSYTPAQSAAIVRGIEVYHVEGNGWNDIGYNFLVDRYGTVYEGRAGGMTRDVIGAHAEGFNTGSVGIALIGNFSVATPPPAQQAALVKLLSWRLDLAHIDPLSTVAYTSGGNFKYPAGKVVTLRAISGHRDTGPSECPGNAAYALLPSIAKRVSVTGLPKVYAPTVAGVLGGPIRFQARLSAALPWTVTISNAQGTVVAHGAGTGQLVDWTWQSPVAKGPYAWAITTPGALAASGTLGRGSIAPPPTPTIPALTLTNLAVTPGVIAPASDGTGGTATVDFTLSTAADVTAQVLDQTGAVVLSAFATPSVAGANATAFDATSLPDGRYLVSLSAKDPTGGQTSATAPFVVDRTLTGLLLAPADFSPNGDGIADVATLSFALTQAVEVSVAVAQGGTTIAALFDTTLAVGPHSFDWDGTDGAGTLLPNGSYTLVVTVTDALGQVQSVLPVTIDTS